MKADYAADRSGLIPAFSFRAAYTHFFPERSHQMKLQTKILGSVILVVAIAYYFMIPRLVVLSVSETNDTSTIRAIGRDHQLYLDEDRMLYYNGEMKFAVPQGSRAVLQVGRISKPVFTIEDLEAR